MQAAKAITAEVQQQYQQAQTSLQETLTTKKQLETDIVHLSSIAMTMTVLHYRMGIRR